jgi:hypothetical protein
MCLVSGATGLLFASRYVDSSHAFVILVQTIPE